MQWILYFFFLFFSLLSNYGDNSSMSVFSQLPIALWTSNVLLLVQGLPLLLHLLRLNFLLTSCTILLGNHKYCHWKQFLVTMVKSCKKSHLSSLCGFHLYLFRIFAEGEIANSTNCDSSDQPLGILPHQIRGSLHQFSQMTLVGHASNSCTACCSTVSYNESKFSNYFHLPG